MSCPVQDETCRACIRCEGGQFIPTKPTDCDCDGSGCSNPDHWTEPTCEHGMPVDAPCYGCAMDRAEYLFDDEIRHQQAHAAGAR